MRKTISFALLFALGACSSSGNTPRIFRDPDTNLYGFQGSSGVLIIPAEYESVRPFNDQGYAQALDPERGWLTIDRFGSVVD